MQNKPILFVDFDGTICMERYWRSLPPDEHRQVQELLFAHDRSMVNDWMRGKYTAEEVNQYTADQTGIEYEYLWKIFIDDCTNMHVELSTLERLSALREQYVVILITGNMDSFSRFTATALQLENYFDIISNSFYEGRHKTDDGGQLFKDYAEKFDLDSLTECILLDDSDKVLDIFSTLGGISYKVTDTLTVPLYLDLIESK